MVNIILDKQSNYFSLKLEGHAAYNVGNDIVCSGVSSITETLLIVLQEEGIKDFIREPGNVKVSGKLNDKIISYLHFAETGYRGISNTYPQNVCFKALQNADT